MSGPGEAVEDCAIALQVVEEHMDRNFGVERVGGAKFIVPFLSTLSKMSLCTPTSIVRMRPWFFVPAVHARFMTRICFNAGCAVPNHHDCGVIFGVRVAHEVEERRVGLEVGDVQEYNTGRAACICTYTGH